jgi:formate dehydrogenase major subunit
MILWGMGISQHVHGTDNARALIALAMVTGQIGRPGTGLHPLRGQNNVQGASDAGLIPMMLPDYRRVAEPAVRAAFEALWGLPLPTEPGLTVVEIMHAAAAGQIRGLYVEGENPAMSDPDLDHARAALARLEHLVVQDLFATETAILADVILPASAHAEKWGTYTNTDRLIQVGRPALPPPGDARQDLWLIAQMARRLGLAWDVWRDAEDGDGRLAREAPVARVYEEMRRTMPGLAGVPWSRLMREDAVTTPAAHEDAPGDAVVFIDRFLTPDGRAQLVPTTYRAGPEARDGNYPFVLTTGRVLEHWHTGAMTRHAQVLDTLAPEPLASLHPDDARALGIADGAPIEVATRHGAVRAVAQLTPEVQPGQVFMAFAYWEAAANRLTGDALDPVAKIPGFKVTAVRVAAA